MFVTTHAGVLSDYANEGFRNNSGFVQPTIFKDGKIKYTKVVSLNPHLPSDYFKDYDSYMDTKYFCPTNRCAFVCERQQKKHKEKKLI